MRKWPIDVDLKWANTLRIGVVQPAAHRWIRTNDVPQYSKELVELTVRHRTTGVDAYIDINRVCLENLHVQTPPQVAPIESSKVIGSANHRTPEHRLPVDLRSICFKNTAQERGG